MAALRVIEADPRSREAIAGSLTDDEHSVRIVDLPTAEDA